jgi:hypothetical protein
MIHVLRASSSGSRSVPCTDLLTLPFSLRDFCISLSVWKMGLLVFCYVNFVFRREYSPVVLRVWYLSLCRRVKIEVFVL